LPAIRPCRKLAVSLLLQSNFCLLPGAPRLVVFQTWDACGQGLVNAPGLRKLPAPPLPLAWSSKIPIFSEFREGEDALNKLCSLWRRSLTRSLSQR